MPKKPNYSEPNTRAKLINPAFRKRGWTAATYFTSRHP